MMQLHHLELYSGVGGMRLAVQAALPAHVQYVCHKAFDVNTNANLVYEHNFKHRPTVLSLEHCTAADLHVRMWLPLLQQQQQLQDVDSSQHHPLLWTLSPPCQPYTTTANSKQADVHDSRASSLAHLLQLLPQLEQLPSHILLENVPSFYASQSHQQLRAVLEQLDYQVMDVALCPSQLGVPHLRRRHYTLAKRRQWQHARQQHCQQQQLAQPHQQAYCCRNGEGSKACSSSDAFSAATMVQLQQLAHGEPAIQLPAAACQPQTLHSYLELDWSQASQPLSQCRAELQQQVARYALPLRRVGRYFKVLDLVAPGLSSHSNCFTKGYGKGILGTGSYLLEDDAARLLAQQDSRGRWHLEQDPYSSSSSSVASSLAALQEIRQQSRAGDSSNSISSCSSVGAARRAVQSSQVYQSIQEHSLLQHGTGAMAGLLEQAPAEKCSSSQVDEGQLPPLLRVRCFTPREVANLQGFPASFSFPECITDRQAYALLGNSVSIHAVSFLVQLLLEDVLGSTEQRQVQHEVVLQHRTTFSYFGSYIGNLACFTIAC
jgi:tRNA (cytosine38-C5)-methyltransferase